MVERQFVFEDFKDLVGSAFTSTAPFSGVSFTLTKAHLFPKQYRILPDVRPPFSLIFIDTVDRILPQSLYELHHESLGDATIFLVPIGKDASGTTYQAVFN